METAAKTVDEAVAEIMRISRSLPPRPEIEEVEAAKMLIRSVEKEDQLRLEAIAMQPKGAEVSEELFFVLQEMQRNLVLFQSKEQKEEATKLLELENLHCLFDDLIQRASQCLVLHCLFDDMTKRVYNEESNLDEEWHTDLLDCCQEPKLCIGTFFFPCGTLSRIASVAKNRRMSPGEACNELVAYSLVLSCCCYTCCIRRRLRDMLNVKGGLFDDFLSHLICCCCSLVQEWREIQIRGVKGPMKSKTTTIPPSAQHMES